MSLLRRTFAYILCVTWLGLLLCRVDLFHAYGRGTGKNKMGFSPLDVAMITGLQTSRARGQDHVVKEIGNGLAIPGEAFRYIQEHGQNSLGKINFEEIWESSKKWPTREVNKLKPIINSKDNFSGIVSLGSVLSFVLVLLRQPKFASALFALSLVGLQTTLRIYEPTVRMTEEFGQSALFIAIAAFVLCE
jgi:hypothetical protein